MMSKLNQIYQKNAREDILSVLQQGGAKFSDGKNKKTFNLLFSLDAANDRMPLYKWLSMFFVTILLLGSMALYYFYDATIGSICLGGSFVASMFAFGFIKTQDGYLRTYSKWYVALLGFLCFGAVTCYAIFMKPVALIGEEMLSLRIFTGEKTNAFNVGIKIFEYLALVSFFAPFIYGLTSIDNKQFSLMALPLLCTGTYAGTLIWFKWFACDMWIGEWQNGIGFFSVILFGLILLAPMIIALILIKIFIETEI